MVAMGRLGVLWAFLFLLHSQLSCSEISQNNGKDLLVGRSMNSWSKSGSRRLLESSVEVEKVGGLRVDLMHRDHINSAFRTYAAGLTFSERVTLAVKRSAQRAVALSRQLEGRSITGSAQSSDFESPVTAGNGEYVMILELGTPSKKYSVIVDTGSDLTWIQCSPCPNCFPQPSPLFDPKNSSTYKALACSNQLCQKLPVVEACSPNCQYFYEYGDQSTTTGVFSSESVTMSTSNGSTIMVTDVAFGCGHDNQGSFSGVDGLIGLGQGPLSFTSQLSTLFQNKFSYCLVSIKDSATQTSPLIFGESAVPSGEVAYTPIVENVNHPTYFYVELTGISVGGELLSIPASTFAIDSSGTGGTILDSGTTITQLVNPAYKVVVETFRTLVKYPQMAGKPAGLDLCFDVSDQASVQVPTLTFHFADVDVNLPAENYFVTIDKEGTLCLAMAGSYGFTIFGNIQQQNYQVLYDRSMGRVGFKKTQCDTL